MALPRHILTRMNQTTTNTQDCPRVHSTTSQTNGSPRLPPQLPQELLSLHRAPLLTSQMTGRTTDPQVAAMEESLQRKKKNTRKRRKKKRAKMNIWTRRLWNSLRTEFSTRGLLSCTADLGREWRRPQFWHSLP